jgi:hypothetical protein
MSRSYKHNPFFKWSDSNKKDKVAAHRKFRRVSKQFPGREPIYMREVSDTWSFASDGLAWYHFGLHDYNNEEKRETLIQQMRK